MSSRKFIVHIGTHKTGTTAIQNHLLANRRSLRKNGIIHIPHPDGHSALKNSKEPDSKASAHFREFLEKRLDIENGKYQLDETVLLSWEGFSGSLIAGYTNVEAVAENLHLSIAPLADDVKIIVYLRRQDLFLESVYSQKVHEGSTSRFAEFRTELPLDAFDWDQLVSAYEKRFGQQNIQPASYNRQALSNPDWLVDDFRNRIGLEPLAEPRYDRTGRNQANLGYSIEALEALRICNASLSEPSRLLLRRTLKKRCPKSADYPTGLWPDSCRSDYLRRQQASNRRLSARYPSIAADLEFPETQSPGKEDAVGTTTEEALKTLATAMTEELKQKRQPLLARIAARMKKPLRTR